MARRAVAFLVSVGALFALVPSALAFTSQPVNPVTMSNKMTDPDEIAEQISNGQSPLVQQGGTGGLQLTAPAPAGGSNSLWSTPSTVFVPSQHR